MSINPQVDIPSAFNDQVKSVDDALNMISSSLSDIKTIGVTDATLARFLFVTQDIPFDDAGKKLSKTFQPKDSDVPKEDRAMAPAIKNYADQVTSGLNSPYAHVLNQNKSPFGDEKSLVSGVDSVGPAAQNFVKKLNDKIKLAMRSMFVSGSENKSNMAGLLMVAIEEIEPQIDQEIEYLKQMKKLVYTILESGSKLPPAFIPEIPNIAIIQRLCKAEQDLNQVSYELEQFQTFDQVRFADAGQQVCSAKTIMKQGLVPPDMKESMKGIFGLNDLQLSTLLTTRFSPDPLFKHSLIELSQLNTFVQELDPQILEVHNNIIDLSSVLVEVQDLGIGNILLLVIDTIKRQIVSIRSDLESQTLSLIKQTGHNAPDRIVVDGQISLNLQGHIEINSQTVIAGQSAALRAPDLAYMQTLIYAQLSALCFILGRAQKMYGNVQSLLNGQSQVVKAISDFATQYGQNKCGDPNGARYVDTAVTHFINAAELRLGGTKESNEVMAAAGQDLIKRIDRQVRFLKCIRGSQAKGQQGLNNKLGHALGGSSNSFQAKNNILNTIRTVPQMQDTLKKLDLRKILGIEKTEYNGLDKLMHGLSLLIQVCPERMTQNIAREFQDRFKLELDRRKASAVTMGSFEEVPQIALQISIKQRVDSINQLVKQLEKFTKVDIAGLCAKGGQGLPSLQGASKISALLTSDVGSTKTVTTRGEKAKEDEQSRKDASASLSPFSSTKLA